MKVAGGRSGEAAAGSPGGSDAAAVPEVNLSNNFCLYANRSIRSIAGIRAPGSVGGCEVIFFFFLARCPYSVLRDNVTNACRESLRHIRDDSKGTAVKMMNKRL